MNRTHDLRRPVPLTQYLRYLGNRLALLSIGGIMTVSGIGGLLLIGLFVVAPTRCDTLLPEVSSWPLLLLLLLPFSLGLVSCGERNIGIARHMEALAPCNRYNIGLLPEQQSLVRASMISPERMSSALLRPVSIASVDPPSQLLRVSESQSQNP